MNTNASSSRLVSLKNRAIDFWDYCAHGVWLDSRRKWWISVVKTLNITVKSFLSTDIQSQACAMTYRTMLALVPALALLVAIGRGFGSQAVLTNELFRLFPGHKEAVAQAMVFVDSYLNQASEGIFVGVGIVFLLWTLISLMSNVENAFNLIWNVKEGRSIWRKITDYTAMFLILPVLMICGSGLSILVSSTIKTIFDFTFMTPLISVAFEIGSYIFTWFFFTAVFMLIPNTKVRFNNAFIAGVFTGTAFMILQWLFVSGQLYVSKYNAIYGSFSFLPLLLIWLQLVWVICLSGALICYASQNIFRFSFSDQINSISVRYKEKVTLAVAAVIVKEFSSNHPAVEADWIVRTYGFPSRLVTDIIDLLMRVGVVSRVVVDEQRQKFAYAPALNPDTMTVADLRTRLRTYGMTGFIPEFRNNFPGVVSTIEDMDKTIDTVYSKILLKDIEIDNFHGNRPKSLPFNTK